MSLKDIELINPVSAQEAMDLTVIAIAPFYQKEIKFINEKILQSAIEGNNFVKILLDGKKMKEIMDIIIIYEHKNFDVDWRQVHVIVDGVYTATNSFELTFKWRSYY